MLHRQLHYDTSGNVFSSHSGEEEVEEDGDHSKEEQHSGDDEDSSEFIENPISSPRVKPIMNGPTTPMKTPSIRSPISSTRRKSLFERKSSRNSRLFSSHVGNGAADYNTKLFSETLNFDDNDDILDFDQSILPHLDHSPDSWKNKLSGNSTLEIEELKKKVTGYQLQIRLIMEFLHKNGTDDLLVKLESENFNYTRCKNCDEKDLEKESIQQELSKYKIKYRKIEEKLNLYQGQLNITNDQLTSLLQAMDEFEILIDENLSFLEDQSDGELKLEINELKELDLNSKLILVLKVSEQLLQIGSNDLQNNSSVDVMNNDNSPIERIKKLQTKFSHSQDQMRDMRSQLDKVIGESKVLVKAYSKLQLAYTKQLNINDKEVISAKSSSSTTDLLTEKLNNVKISDEISKDHEERNKELEAQIKLLEDEKLSLSDEVISLQTQLSKIARDYASSRAQLESDTNELKIEVRELQNQLQLKNDELLNSKQEISYLQTTLSMKQDNNENKINYLVEELKTATENQRKLTAEIADLEQELHSIRDDKLDLEYQVEHLENELTQQRMSKTDNLERFWKMRYDELLFCDTKIVKRFLKIFDQVLDSQSIEQAKVKILELSNRSSLPKDQKKVRELHESIFQYSVSGAQAIIKDYLSLIKQFELGEKEKNLKILNLSDEVKKLRNQNNPTRLDSNGQVQLQVEKDENLWKFRIEDLTKKWKLERESRKSEGDNLRKRLNELENENMQLKRELELLRSSRGSGDLVYDEKHL